MVTVSRARRRALIALLGLAQAVASGSIPLGMTVGTAASIRLTDEPALAGLFIATQVTAGAAAARVAGARADTRGRRPVLAAGFLALGAVLAALAVESDSVVVLVVAAALFGIGTSLVSVVRTAASDRARRGRVGAIVGLVATGGAIGGIAAPLLVAGATRFHGGFDPAALALSLVSAAALATALSMVLLRPDNP